MAVASYKPGSEGLFELGKVSATGTALSAIAGAGMTPQEVLARHASGDRGCDADDDDATLMWVRCEGNYASSSYPLSTGEMVLVVTTGDIYGRGTSADGGPLSPPMTVICLAGE